MLLLLNAAAASAAVQPPDRMLHTAPSATQAGAASLSRRSRPLDPLKRAALAPTLSLTFKRG